jgi:N-acetyl-anhydromuramyl-L-alanine amidase AmpD
MAYLPDNKYERRKVTNYLVVHCSATKPSQDIGVEDIREWHIKQRHWIDCGYHYVVKRDGTVEMGRPTWAIGSHVEDHNFESVGICLVGGLDEQGQAASTFTDRQFESLWHVLYLLKRDSYQKAQIVGHRDIQVVTDKDCPCFDAKKWWAPFDKQVQREINQRQCIG